MKRNIISDQPTGIIKTMPREWIMRLPCGLKDWEREFMGMNDSEGKYWIFNLPGMPRFDVIYFFLLFDGAVRYRANIIGYEGDRTIKCYTGETKHGRVWVQVSAPVIKLSEPIPMKGFQGFRYAYNLTEETE